MSGRAQAIIFLGLWAWLSSAVPTFPGPVDALSALADGGGAELASGVELALPHDGTNLEVAGSYTGPTSGRLTVDQVAALVASTGLRGNAAATAVAIAGWDGAPCSCESGGLIEAEGDQHLANRKWSNSVGLFQVRSLHSERGRGTARDIDALRGNPRHQAAAMLEISRGGTYWRPWSVYTSGKYRANLDQARAAVERGGWS